MPRWITSHQARMPRSIVSRVALRDYVDAAAALQRYTISELITLAQRLDPD
jgi:hypothetical protein